jgi:hypothetical protein
MNDRLSNSLFALTERVEGDCDTEGKMIALGLGKAIAFSPAEI